MKARFGIDKTSSYVSQSTLYFCQKSEYASSPTLDICTTYLYEISYIFQDFVSNYLLDAGTLRVSSRVKSTTELVENTSQKLLKLSHFLSSFRIVSNSLLTEFSTSSVVHIFSYWLPYRSEGRRTINGRIKVDRQINHEIDINM